MNASERRALLEEVRLASSCSHPIRICGEMVQLDTGEIRRRELKVACKDRRQVLCPACASLYKADAWILISAGLVGGKGVDQAADGHPKVFFTLTAPSFGAVHTTRANGTCHPRSKTQGFDRCGHGQPRSCDMQHEGSDEILGSPLCLSCFDYRAAVLWNAHASRLFSHTMRQLQRRLAAAGGVKRTDLWSVARINYLKVAEVQRRGLIHFHGILRADGSGHASSAPPSWLTAEFLSQTMAEVVRSTTVTGSDGGPRGWGRQFDLAEVEPGDSHAASYLAKYSIKTTDGSKHFAYRFRTRRQIEQLGVDDHRRTLALTAWDLARQMDYRHLNLRLHAQAFGFTGQLITKSRGFTTTFQALRAARADFMARSNEFRTIEGTFTFTGRGYDHPRAVELANVFFTMDKELRHERVEARKRARMAHMSELDARSQAHDGAPQALVEKKFALPRLGSDLI